MKTLVAMTVVGVLAVGACSHAPKSIADEFLAELHRSPFNGSGQTDALLVQAGEDGCALYGAVSPTEVLQRLMQQYHLTLFDANSVLYTAKVTLCQAKYRRLG